MFETSLAASRPQFAQRNRKLLPAAVAFHGALIAGVVLASYWSVSDVPDPDGMVGVVFQAAGPPPPLGTPQRAPSRPPSAPTRAPVATPPVVQPQVVDIPDTPPAIEAPVDDGAGDDSSITLLGDLGGSGVPWGVDGGTGDPNGGGGDAAAIGDDTPIVIRAGVTPPRLQNRVLPRYTESARRMRREGTVFLEAIIDRDGRVANIRVLKGLGFGLDEEAVSAVQQWTYEPARLGSRVISVYLTVRVDFKLQ
jgi:TonB family protein